MDAEAQGIVGASIEVSGVSRFSGNSIATEMADAPARPTSPSLASQSLCSLFFFLKRFFLYTQQRVNSKIEGKRSATCQFLVQHFEGLEPILWK